MAVRALRAAAIAGAKRRRWIAPSCFVAPAMRAPSLLPPIYTAAPHAIASREYRDVMHSGMVRVESGDAPDLDASYRSFWRKIEHSEANIVSALKQWESAGNTFTKEAMLAILQKLRERRRHRQATMLLLFAAEQQRFQLVEKDFVQLVTFACRIKYFDAVHRALRLMPPHLDKVPVHSALISGHADLKLVNVAESLMGRYKPACVKAYNSMIHMYLRAGRHSKVGRFFSSMKEAGVEPNVLTYTLLIKYSDRIGEIEGLKEEALEALDNVDLDSLEYKYPVAGNMLMAYSYLGKAASVQRLWAVLDQERWLPPGVYVKAIDAFARVGEPRKAERIAKIREGNPKVYERLYHALARHYLEAGRIEKVEETLVKSAEMRIRPGFTIYNHLITAYLANNEADKALTKLKEALEVVTDDAVPTHDVVMAMLPVLAQHKDMRCAEALVGRYKGWRTAQLYNELLKVYAQAAEPVRKESFIERMKRHKAFPNKETVALLDQLDPSICTTSASVVEELDLPSSTSSTSGEELDLASSTSSTSGEELDLASSTSSTSVEELESA